MNSEKLVKKDKNQNIQVFVRLRPINGRERDLKSLGVVEVSGSRDVLVRQSPLDSKLSKKFTFDRAFGPASKQVDVYQEVVSPLIEEVLAGYNCTVFAYGQTGTGKTHTMVGESSGNSDLSWQDDPMSGIIPRSLSQLFDELRITNSEYTVRVSYLELYNEELFDLLSTGEDNSKLRIYEDVTRKGSNIVNGLEEVTVYNKNEVYKIMAKGQERRRIASTLMNAQSSRSHTVFTIVVHMKENSPEGEELMKIGKLNLVDLAGSENISKAGTDNPARRERARECVNINQSLLTLGRVITCLVERHPHIPYRESKLTRLLQESLGGRTKTSIIATISPGHRDVEETLSTLEYAYRARNIQNKPEINQKITKHAVLKEYSEEIDRLKRDLQASRDKHGVHLSNDAYAEILLKDQEQTKEIQEQLLHIKALKEQKERVEVLFGAASASLEERESQLASTAHSLGNVRQALAVTRQELAGSRDHTEEQKALVSRQADTERLLTDQARVLQVTAAQAAADAQQLQDSIHKKRTLEENNLETVKDIEVKSTEHRCDVRLHLIEYEEAHLRSLADLQHTSNSHAANQAAHLSTAQRQLAELRAAIETALKETRSQYVKDSEITRTDTAQVLAELGEQATARASEPSSAIATVLARLAELEEGQRSHCRGLLQMRDYVRLWNDASAAKLETLQLHQKEWQARTTSTMEELVRRHMQCEEQRREQHRASVTLSRMQHEEISKNMVVLKASLAALEECQTVAHLAMESEAATAEVAQETSGQALAQVLASEGHALQRIAATAAELTTAVTEENNLMTAELVGLAEQRAAGLLEAQDAVQNVQEAIRDISSSNQESWRQHSLDMKKILLNKAAQGDEALEKQHQNYCMLLERNCATVPRVLAELEMTMQEENNHSCTGLAHLTRLGETLHDYADSLRSKLADYEETESTIIAQEYHTYSPTGKTPVRKEYSYPRDLAATSPHEVIIRRFRQQKLAARAQEVAPLQSEVEPTVDNIVCVEDSEGSVSSSPPASPGFVVPAPPTLLSKCPSDSDIYSLKHSDQQSKENLNRSENSSSKKDHSSRLRQPNIIQKKILGDHN